MGFLENLRQWTSERFDDLTGQENIYHKSTGKTQKEFENDLKTYKALELGLDAETALLMAGLGAAGGSALASATATPQIIGDIAVASTLPGAASTISVPTIAPQLAAGIGAGAGSLLGLGTVGGEKAIDSIANGNAWVQSNELGPEVIEELQKRMKPSEWEEFTEGGSLTNDQILQKIKSTVAQRLSEAGYEDEGNDNTESVAENTVTEEEGARESEKEPEVETPKYDIDEMAGEFILGAWGNGQERIDNMLNAGYTIDDYNKIQQRVNEAYASGRDLHEWTNKANAKLGYW